MLKNKTLFIFDLDGTLVDSFRDVSLSMNEALHKLGFDPLSQYQVRQLIGPDLEEAIVKTVNDDRFSFAQFIEYYVESYHQHMTRHTCLFEGVEDVLLALKKEDKACVVLTNKPEDQAAHILQTLRVDHFFSMIIGPDTFDRPKPDPFSLFRLCEKFQKRKDDCVMIGDTETDMKTARNAAITSVGVTYGYRTENELSLFNPDILIHSLEELLKHC